MTFFTSVTASEPKPVPKLHLFLVCKPKEKKIKMNNNLKLIRRIKDQKLLMKIFFINIVIIKK